MHFFAITGVVPVAARGMARVVRLLYPRTFLHCPSLAIHIARLMGVATTVVPAVRSWLYP